MNNEWAMSLTIAEWFLAWLNVWLVEVQGVGLEGGAEERGGREGYWVYKKLVDLLLGGGVKAGIAKRKGKEKKRKTKEKKKYLLEYE